MKMFVRSLLNQERIAGGAAVLALTQLLASVCGFLRDQAFSVTFPLSEDPIGVASVYIAAFRPSDLLFQMTVMSCLSVVLVPFLATYLKRGEKDQMSRITTSTIIVFGLFFGTTALLLALFFPLIAPLFVQFKGESLTLYIRFGRIALMTNFLFVFGNTFGQYLITMQRYWIYGLTPIVWSLSTILGTYFLTPIFGVMGPIYGTLIGTVLYVIIRYYAILRQGFKFLLPKESFLHGDLRHMGILIIPRMIALGALQVQLLMLDRLASGLGTRYVALNQFASNFESVIPGIIGIALAQSSFSLMSQAASNREYKTLTSHLAKGCWYNILFGVPGAFVLAGTTGIAAWLMQLSSDTTALFQQSLMIYAIAVPFESINHLLLRTFYSLKNTLFPALSSVISCLTAIYVGYIFIPSQGLIALAVAYCVAQVCQTLFLGVSVLYDLRKRINVSSGQLL